MNNIAIARRLRGMTAKMLADRINVTCQQIGNWEQGLRNPGRAASADIASALDVDIAWIAGYPQITSLADPLSGEALAASIIRSETIDGYGVMQHLYINATGDIVAVINAGGFVFTPSDWQGQQPQDVSEIAEYSWVDGLGRDAVMIDRLPRVLA